MKDEFSIGSNSMRRMTKQELINAINKTFSDDCGTIAVITECESTNSLNGDKIVTQSVTFGKMLELNS